MGLLHVQREPHPLGLQDLTCMLLMAACKHWLPSLKWMGEPFCARKLHVCIRIPVPTTQHHIGAIIFSNINCFHGAIGVKKKLDDTQSIWQAEKFCRHGEYNNVEERKSLVYLFSQFSVYPLFSLSLFPVPQHELGLSNMHNFYQFGRNQQERERERRGWIQIQLKLIISLPKMAMAWNKKIL